MASTLLSEGYETNIQIRCGVAADDLPKATIDVVLSPIEAKMKMRITTYASLSGNDKTFFDSGVECAIAAACCPILKNRLPKREKALNTDIESGMDWDKRKAELEAESEEYLSSVAGHTHTDITVTLFAVNGPIRAGNSNFS